MKRVPVGVEDFKRVVDEDYYYVDKSMFIKEVMQEVVVLYTRPRRFGKTLNMSMLNYFYNIKEKENAYLFNELAISKDEEVMQHQNKYPVIFLSLKDMKRDTFERQIEKFQSMVSKIIEQHTELLSSNQLDEYDKNMLLAYRKRESSRNDIEDALLNISQCLEKHYKEKVVILIDEYDVPLQHAYLQGYYDEMVGFLRNVFSAALKTNFVLRQGILTGCLRIAKESIFTGMNNFSVYGITEEISASYFGFTPNEVQEILSYYDLLAYENEVKNWYNGYLFGKQEMYNPWSIIHYVKKAIQTSDQTPVSFWANTSGNDIVMRYIQQGDRQMKEEFDTLVNRGSIVKKIMPELTYREMDNIDNIYSFLLFTGYLKIGKEIDRSEDMYELKIPNEEVRKVYMNQFEVAFKEYTNARKDMLMQYLHGGKAIEVNNILNDILERSISYYDNKESFYHGLLLGLLSEYEVISNEEAGTGRLDIAIRPRNIRDNVVIIECKHAKDEDDLMDASEEAIQQIEEKGYMKKKAYQMYGGVIGYGISFYKKQCYVVKSE